MKGTKITYRGAGKANPKKDNLSSMNHFEHLPKIKDKEYMKQMRNPDNLFIHITEDNVYSACKLWYKRFPFLLIEPNPVTFYFSIASDVCRQFYECHQQLAAILKKDLAADIKGGELAAAYSYTFKVTSVGIIFSFLAIEAFLNQQLPKYEKIVHKGKVVSKEKVERFFTFDQKIDEVIPVLAGKDFNTVYPKQRILIKSLKQLRDNLTHLKQKKGSGLTRYEELYQTMLTIDLIKIVHTVKRFINFYYPKLIVNYTCNPS